MPHFFKSIKIQNLLSFGPDSRELELKPINIVIGPNGSGKSNLLTALSLFRPQEERHSIIENGGGFRNWFWKSNDTVGATVKVIFESAIKWASRSFEVALVKGKDQQDDPSRFFVGLTIPEDVKKDFNRFAKDVNQLEKGENIEKLFFSVDYHVAGDHISLQNLPQLETHAEGILESINEFRTSFFLFRDWQYGPSAPLRSGPQPAGFSNNRIRDDARNLAHVLKRITENKQSCSVFKDFLSELYEDINDIQFTEAEDFLFFFVIENGGRKVPAARISDGTLRYLALLAVLCDPEPPHLICLEEPEMGLHPDLIQVVAKAIRYASERAQIIATTHSVLLVDKFTDSPDSIVVCEKIDGSTELRRLDPEEMKPWLEKYRLGNLWTSGQIGGNRW